MKTPWVFGIVAGAHVLAVAGVMLIQGCGTTPPGTIPEEVETVMPPSAVEPAPASIEPTPPPPEVTEWPPKSSSEYVVKKGDSLSKIAARYGLRTRELAALNGIDNPNKIRIGQKLSIPGADGTPSATVSPKPAPKSNADTSVTASDKVCVVKKGDCLSKIAAAHGCTTKALRTVNSLKSDKIIVGQKLVLPTGAKAPKASASRPVSKPQPKPQSEEAAAVAPESDEDMSGSGPMSFDSAPVELPDPDVGAATGTDMREHIVGEDEDLPRIAMRYGVTATRLKEVNGLIDGVVRPGQKIMIPLE